MTSTATTDYAFFVTTTANQKAIDQCLEKLKDETSYITGECVHCVLWWESDMEEVGRVRGICTCGSDVSFSACVCQFVRVCGWVTLSDDVHFFPKEKCGACPEDKLALTHNEHSHVRTH